jgi:hypothetical protein
MIFPTAATRHHTKTIASIALYYFGSNPLLLLLLLPSFCLPDSTNVVVDGEGRGGRYSAFSGSFHRVSVYFIFHLV